MTATNHILSGAAIGLFIKEPALALPLALVSHFVLDALPHFGFHTWAVRRKHIKLFNRTTGLDIIMALVVFIFLFVLHAGWLAVLCGLLAYLPDSAWIYRFAISEKMGTISPPSANRFNQFHSNIQMYETIKLGGIIEVVALLVFAVLVGSQLL